MPVQLTIVGGGSLKEELQAYINDNELREYATLIGFDVNPYKYVAKSDLFVCSSYSEGFSSVVAESLFLGVPVVTTDCAGMRELLGSNNEFGVIVSNDEEGLYKGISNMVENPEFCADIERQVREILGMHGKHEVVEKAEIFE